jgi:hypothetical protein
MIPFFMAAHLVTGIASEPRQMLPLSFVIIPTLFYTIFQISRETPVEDKQGFDSSSNPHSRSRTDNRG